MSPVDAATVQIVVEGLGRAHAAIEELRVAIRKLAKAVADHAIEEFVAAANDLTHKPGEAVARGFSDPPDRHYAEPPGSRVPTPRYPSGFV